MTGISRQAIQPESLIWRGMSLSDLDAAYDNTRAVSQSAAFLAEWSTRSSALRADRPEMIDLEYGPRERNRIDIFSSGARNAPLFVFIHGGYWQRNSRAVFSCMAEGLLPYGIDVALPGYTLAPEATLADIVYEIRTAIVWLRREGPGLGIAAGRLIVAGWSAGGHLAATAMALPEVDAGLAISGIFDLEPIRLGSLNEKVGLGPEDVRAFSPLHNLPKHAGELVISYGTNELPELQRQSRGYASAWKQNGLPGILAPVEGADHFSILEELRKPDGALARRVNGMAN